MGAPLITVRSQVFFQKASLKGDPRAENNIGVCYQLGIGLPKNEAKAAGWLERAATKGHPDAQYNLGMCFEQGRGVAQNMKEALKWYGAAAAMGHVKAKKHFHKLNASAGPAATTTPAADADAAEAAYRQHKWDTAFNSLNALLQSGNMTPRRYRCACTSRAEA
jgi:TPR repeat protein